MKTITITVKEKIATTSEDAFIVCGNSDIKASFVFDSEWDDAGTKTAVFVCSNGAAYYAEIVGDSCGVPVLYGTSYVKIGVVSAAIKTSTSATVVCKAAVTDEAQGEGSIGQNQYEVLCQMVDGRFPTGGEEGDLLIKQSDEDYDAVWGGADLYCKAEDVYTKAETDYMFMQKAPTRQLIRSVGATEEISDRKDYLLEDVTTVCFVCDAPLATDSSIMLTTAADGEISISFNGLTDYIGPDPAEATNGEVWEFNILYGRCIGRKWA